MILKMVYFSGNEQSKNSMLQPGYPCSLDVLQYVDAGCGCGIFCVSSFLKFERNI